MANNRLDYDRKLKASQSTDHNVIPSSATNGEASSSSNMCSIQSVNIDSSNDKPHIASNPTATTTPTTTSILRFTSTWKRNNIVNDDHSNNSVSLIMIQIIFTIPYSITNNSILNKTIFIIDVTHNQLLASLNDFCVNVSSFIINYTTVQPLPHNICLYLLLKLKSSTNLQEIMFCRTIDDSHDNASSSNDTSNGGSHAAGPSEFFILSQWIIIFIMMFIIYGVHTIRQKRLVNRVRRTLARSRAVAAFIRQRSATRKASTLDASTTVNPATTLQRGLNNLIFYRQMTSIPNHGISESEPIEQRVLGAADLTTTMQERRTSRVCVDRDLIDVKEFTNRIAEPTENLTNTELNTR